MIFVVFDQGNHAALFDTIRSFIFIQYPENAKYPPDKNCMPCSRHKIMWKLAYLIVKMTSLIQKLEIVRTISVYKNC